MDWNTLRNEFPITRRWAFFDHAAVAPLSGRAQRAMTEWAADMAENGDVHEPTCDDPMVAEHVHWALEVHGG